MPAPQQKNSTAAQHAVAWLRLVGASGAGVSGALAIVLTLGLLAWAPLGALAAHTGLAAAFATVTVGGLVVALLSRGSVPTAGPSSATALLLAALLARLVHAEGTAAEPAPLAGLLLAAGAAVVVMGALQLLIARMGLARLVHYVPHAVLAGFMNGVALLILMSQLPALLGPWKLIREQGLHTGSALLGLGTACGLWLLAWKRPTWPAALLALLCGALAWHAAALLWPHLDLGPTAGEALGGWPMPVALLALANPKALQLLVQHADAVLVTGLLLALIGSMETLMSLAAIEQPFNRRPDARRELTAMGCANVAGGLFAALPCVAVRARAQAMSRAGAIGRRPALVAAGISLLLFGLGGPLLGAIPSAVLAAIMITIGVSLFDRWSLRLLLRWWRGSSADLLPTLAVVGSVCALTTFFGLAVGVAVGLLLSTVVLMRGLNLSLIRARFSGQQRPSRRVWPPADEAVLLPRRHQILLLELEGSLFFGTGQRLTDEADALPAGCRWLVLDMRRLSTVDDSGAMVLVQLAQSLQRRGISLLLGGLSADTRVGHSLQALGLEPGDPALPWFGTADLALERAEAELLGPRAVQAQDLPLAACTLAFGLDTAAVQRLAQWLQPRDLAAGDVLFHQGDAADSLFVLTRGSVSASGGQGAQHQRYSSLSAGTMVGETALLSSGGRSATVVADVPTHVLELTREALAQIQLQDPALAVALHRNMGAHLAQRLRAATVAWHASAG